MASIDNLIVNLLVDEVVGGFLVNIKPGQVGCIFNIFTGVMKNVWRPGMHFKLPFIYRVKIFNTELIEYSVSKDRKVTDNPEIMGDEVINAVTSDNKFVAVEATALIKINVDKLPEIWQNIGENFVSKVVRPVVRSRIRKVITGHTLNNALASSRTKIEDELKVELRESLMPHGLEVDNVYLSSLTPLSTAEVPTEVIKIEPKTSDEQTSSRMSGKLM